MTLEELLRHIELKNPPFPMRLYAERGSYNGCAYGKRLLLEVAVPDRDTGERTAVIHTHDWALDHPMHALPDQQKLNAIRRFIRGVVMHEVDEAFHLDGTRVFDPHRGGDDAANHR